MLKPANYDQVQVVRYNPLTPGPHRCVIQAVEETYSSTAGNEMLKITVDTDRTDSQPEHFRNLDRKPMKWLVTDAKTEYGTQNLKSFICAVEASNPGFQVFWGDKIQFEAQFRGKRIGCNFGEEEYLNDKGETKTAVKPIYFFDYAKCDEQKVPGKKMLGTVTPSPQNQNAYQNGYQAAQQQTVQSAQIPPQYQQPTAQYQQQTMNQYAPPQQGFMDLGALPDECLPFA